METNNPNKGATFVKHGLLAKPQTVAIAAVRQGNFGKTDIEFVVSGRRFIVSVSPKNPNYAALCDAFGTPDQWVGNTILVMDSNVVRTVEVSPVARKDGKPIAV
jgi:hypothetical protein